MEVVINTHITASGVAEDAWFKSSYSNDSGGACVEIADLASQVGIRDSKNKQGAPLFVPVGAWAAFITQVQVGEDDTS